jgi:AdoMet-dependent rRNA methyltransferase SPB1
MDEYRQRLREFNARPIKKVAEAKMRKRKKEASKQRLAKKRAQRIVDDPEMEQQEKVREMKKSDCYILPQIVRQLCLI